MTLPQATSFAIILCTVGLFVWGRIPYDLVALMALFAGVATGIVPVKHAFDGFGDDIIVIIATALIISVAIARSGVIETLMRPLLPRLTTERTQVIVLAGAVAFLSMFCKNVGALAIFMPVAMQLSRRTGTSPASLLMPMSFASLLGGLVTLIGTSPNIIVSQIRQQVSGHPFGMFDYAPVGLVIAVVGLVFLGFGYRLVPRGRRAAATMDAAFSFERYVTETRLGSDSALVGRSVAELERLGDGDVRVATIIRERFRRYVPRPDWLLEADDVLLLEGEPEDLERIVSRGRLLLSGELHGEMARAVEDQSVVEGVVTAGSTLLGRTVAQSGLTVRFGLTVLAVSRSGRRISQRLGTLRFRLGDVAVLKGATKTLPEALGEIKVLPLAERRVGLGMSHRGWTPALILLVAMIVVATHLVPVAIAFMGAAIALMLTRVLTMHEAYESIEWSLLILIASLIPISQAVRRTGGADLIASGLLHVFTLVPSWSALGIILVLSMGITPFLHNAPTVLILGPIAATLAQKLHLHSDAFLMAVALGAGCDFLTPIGHQCNTLVYGPGGYRFGDYWRLGLPLSIVVVVLGVPMISLVWGL